jgi:hypothetical protein
MPRFFWTFGACRQKALRAGYEELRSLPEALFTQYRAGAIRGITFLIPQVSDESQTPPPYDLLTAKHLKQ